MRSDLGFADKLRAFEAYNRGRIDIAMQIMPRQSALAIHLVPLILNYNIKGLPGYYECDSECAGISLFRHSNDMTITAAKHIPHFRDIEKEMKKTPKPDRPIVDSLLLMGSIGTAAQSDKSDYDFWVVVNEKELGPEKVKFLGIKLRLIEEWAAKKGAEFHFFITDENRVRVNDFGSASRESVGSSQAGLLKEEFYRTMLHVAGKYPVWWLTDPAADDTEYENTLKELSNSSDPSPEMFVDLGNLQRITLDEYYGAALWQVNKAADYPFKSMAKMSLLESFINAEGEALLLCEELKQRVLDRTSSIYGTDPYMIMIDRLLNYYSQKKRQDIVDVIRQCFYITIRVNLGNVITSRRRPTYKEETMLRYTSEWKWGNIKITRLDNYHEWDFKQVMELGKQLHDFMIETYQTFTKQYKLRRITKEDFAVLGRKVLAYNYPKRGKIMPVRRAVDEGLRQESITFRPNIRGGKKTIWEAYRGNVITEVARKVSLDHAVLRAEKSLVDLIAWLVINRVSDSGTFVHLIPNPLPVSLRVIQQLGKKIEEVFPYQSISSIDNSLLLKEAFVTDLLTVANFSSQQWVKNIEEITLIYRNSHGEMFSESREAQAGYARMKEILADARPLPGRPSNNTFQIFIPRHNSSAKLEQKIRTAILNNLGQSRS